MLHAPSDGTIYIGSDDGYLYAIKNGADEVDMVINIGALKDKNYSLVKEDIEGESSSLLTLDIADKSIEEQISMEVKRSLRFYVKEAGNSDFRKILLTGGSAKLKGLPEYIQENLNIPTEVYNPFSNLEMPEKFKDKQDPQLALALGLAMRPE